MAVPPPPTYEDFGRDIFATPPRAPTLERRGAVADVEKTEAETEKLNLTLPAIKEKADAEAAAAQHAAKILGFEKADEEFQKLYVQWRSGSSADLIANTKLLRDAVRLLKSGKSLTGPVLSRLPAIVREKLNPESVDVRSDVEKAIQASLRDTLGAQFTKEEGLRIMANTFNPALPESMVAANVEAELNKVLDLAVSREALSRYYEENRTVANYKADAWKPAVAAEFDAMSGVPKKEQAAAEAANYRDAMNNIGGDPIRGWRLRPGEEQQLIAYANSADFTPEGFVDMASDLITLASGQEPDRKALMAEAQSIAERPEGARLGSVDYSNVDAAAAKNAGLSEVAIQSLKNVPESSVQLVSGLLSPVSDALRSAVLGERVGVYKTFPDLIADVASKAGIVETDEATINALSDVMTERYGSLEDFKQTFATDPLGVAGDASMILTFGGTAAGRAPGVVGRAGQRLAKVGEALDPLSFAGNMARRVTPDAVTPDAAGRLAAEGVSMTTGAPASAFRQAFERGAERQRVGPTPTTETFREGITGQVDPVEMVNRAKTAMQEMRDAASREYRSGMVDISNDKSVLSFNELDRALDQMRRDATYKGKVVKPGVLATVDEMEAIINDWRALDPNEFHTPEGFDKLKQRLFEATEDIPFEDRTRRRAAGAVYGATKDTINKQAPAYAGIMNQYADAQQTLGRMESELGLGRAPVDTAAVKLTQRPPSRKGRDDLLTMLADYDPELAAQVAGEQLSPAFPRGIRGAGAGLGAALGVGNIATLGTLSPRIMGEAAYVAGRASVPIGQTVDFIQRNPAAVLAAQRGLAATEATGAELEQQELMERYGLSMPLTLDEMAAGDAITADTLRLAAEQPAPAVNLGGFEPTYDTNVDELGRTLDPLTGLPIEEEEILGMQRGGAVKGYKNGGLMDMLPDAEDVAGFGRSVARGATFATNDEIEAYLRTLFDKDPDAYENEVNRIRRAQRQYEEDHPGWAAAGEIGGAVGTAFVPGMQGLSAARVASMGPKARAAYELALATGQGSAYGAGSMYDDPDSERDPLAVFVSETAAGTLGYPAGRAIGAGGRELYRRAPQGAKDFVARNARRALAVPRRKGR